VWSTIDEFTTSRGLDHEAAHHDAAHHYAAHHDVVHHHAAHEDAVDHDVARPGQNTNYQPVRRSSRLNVPLSIYFVSY